MPRNHRGGMRWLRTSLSATPTVGTRPPLRSQHRSNNDQADDQPSSPYRHICPAEPIGSHPYHRTTPPPRQQPASEAPRQPARVLDAYSHRTPALVAQGIEHGSPKAGVAGSNPAEGTQLPTGGPIARSQLPPRPHYCCAGNTQFHIRNTQRDSCHTMSPCPATEDVGRDAVEPPSRNTGSSQVLSAHET